MAPMEDTVLDEMGREECILLLRRCTVGRVAVNVDGTAPLVVPVNYVVDDDDIVFRTDGGTKLAAVGRGAMSFEIDDIDHGHHAGWSVLVRGTVEPLSTDDLPPAGQRPRPWVEGSRPLHLRLTPRSITGRRLLPG